MKKLTFVLVLFFAIIFILFLNFFPNLYGFWRTPKGYFYSGQASWFDPWDINAYVAAIKWGQSGHIFLNNLYTTDEQKPTFVYPFYTLIGKFFSKSNPFLLFHFFSLIIGLFLSLTVFLLAYSLLKDKIKSLFSLILVSLGGGVGWLVGDRLLSADVSITSFTYHTAFQRPHEGLAVIFYLGAFLFYFFGLMKKNLWLNFLSLFSMIFLIFFYPFFILSYAIVTGLFSLFLFQKRKERYPIFFFGLNTIFAGVVFLFYSFHLWSRGFLEAVPLTIKADLVSVILGYGFLLPFCFYQIFTLKSNEDEKIFLCFWFLVSFIFGFFLPFGRFYFRGLFFPLGLLSVMGVSKISHGEKFKECYFVFLLTLITSFSSFYIFSQRINEAGKNNRWFYLRKEIKEGFLFLEKRKENGILASYTLGNYLPAFTGKNVYFGHWVQTPKSSEKWVKLINFYSGKYSEEEANKFLKEGRINVIVYSDEEKEIGKLKYSFLKRIYKNEKIEIYGKR